MTGRPRMVIDPFRAPNQQKRPAGDPAPAPPPVGVLPVLRLRRLHASDALVERLAGMWDAMDEAARVEMADAMAALGDRELMTRLVGSPPMGKGPDAVVEWAQTHDLPADAARHALSLGAGGPDAAERLADLAGQ